MKKIIAGFMLIAIASALVGCSGGGEVDKPEGNPPQPKEMKGAEGGAGAGGEVEANAIEVK